MVSSAGELQSALGSASSGDVVYVAGGATVDAGSSEFTVPAGVTLASDRGVDGAEGGRIATGEEVWPLFTLEEDARVTGVRVDGPHSEYVPHSKPVGIGLKATATAEIDNCEVSGFSHAGVSATGDTHVHHSHVHHNPMDGLGYGVLCKGGHPVIEYNAMDYNRHSVSSDGEGGYTARYNRFGPHTFGHVIDCHQPGGSQMAIHHNTVEAVEKAQSNERVPGVAIRGTPDSGARIEKNWFHNPAEPRASPDGWTSEAIIQVHTSDWRHVSFDDNAYGSSSPGSGVGCPR